MKNKIATVVTKKVIWNIQLCIPGWLAAVSYSPITWQMKWWVVFQESGSIFLL